MNSETVIQTVYDFLTGNPLIALILLAVAIIAVVKKTKQAIQFVILLLFLAGGYYVFSELGSASFHGLKATKEGSAKSSKALE